MRQKIEYAQEGAVRNSSRPAESIREVLERMGRDGWEAWHMEDLTGLDGRVTDQVRIYFRRPFILFP